MKILKLPLLAIAFMVLLFAQSCKKSDSSSDSFNWTWDGTNYTGNFKEAFIQSLGSGSNIIAGTGTSINSAGTGPRINVSSLNAGTYTLGSGITNSISFIDPFGNNLASTSGTLNITANANSKLSGNFSATLVNGIGFMTSITGSFSNIKINP